MGDCVVSILDNILIRDLTITVCLCWLLWAVKSRLTVDLPSAPAKLEGKYQGVFVDKEIPVVGYHVEKLENIKQISRIN